MERQVKGCENYGLKPLLSNTLQCVEKKGDANHAKRCARGSAGFQPVLAGILPGRERCSPRECHRFRDERVQHVSGRMPDTATKMVALPRGSRSG